MKNRDKLFILIAIVIAITILIYFKLFASIGISWEYFLFRVKKD